MIYRTTLDLPDDLGKRYEELARQAGEQPAALMREALEAYVDQLAEDSRRLDAAIAAADRGELVDSDEADAEIEALLRARGITADQLTALRATARLRAPAKSVHPGVSTTFQRTSPLRAMSVQDRERNEQRAGGILEV